jgi:type IV secretory pathway TrbF-like protein
MANPISVNPQVIDLINQVQRATLCDDRITRSGAGKAYQSVAQSGAIAVQDATDALRNISTIATTAAGVAVAQLLATGNDKYALALQDIQKMMTSASDDYAKVSAAATVVVQNFPSK